MLFLAANSRRVYAAFASSVFAPIEVPASISCHEICRGARHPRGNEAWPLTGILAQRAKDRPNRIGATICRLLSVDGLRIEVAGLDAIDHTPVLGVKPVMSKEASCGE